MLIPDSTLAVQATAAALNLPAKAPLQAIEQTMLADDKLFVVLTVVLLIWAGLIVLVLRTDRRLRALEQLVDSNYPSATPLT